MMKFTALILILIITILTINTVNAITDNATNIDNRMNIDNNNKEVADILIVSNNDPIKLKTDDKIAIGSLVDNLTIENESESKLKDMNLEEVYVSIDGDDNNGDGSWKNPYKSIEQAIEKCSENGIIYLSAGEYKGDKNRNISIDKAITIKGEGEDNTIINGEDIARIFLMNSSASLTLINLTITNGFEAPGEQIPYGGGINNIGGNLTLINTTIKNCDGNTYGGAIYQKGGSLTLINSTIQNNTADFYAGGIYIVGPANIYDSKFISNNVSDGGGVGGALLLAGKGFINNTVFDDNYAGWCVAGICNLGYLEVNNCSFINGKSPYAAGGISNHNIAIINNSYFGFNDVSYYAAAILAPPGSESHTYVYNTIIENNHAGMFATVLNAYKQAYVTIEKTSISGNYVKRNSMYGDLASDENISAQYCWWGSNVISPYYICEDNEGIINASKWLIMSFNSNNTEVYTDEYSTFTVDIKNYFDNDTKEVYKFNEDINLPLKVKFYTNTGEIINTTLSNGTVSISYKPNSNVNVIYAKIDNQTLKINVKKRTVTKIESDNINEYYPNKIQLNAKISTFKGNPIENKTVNITISSKNWSKTYSCTSDENGNINLDLNLKTGSYTATFSSSQDDTYKSTSKTIEINISKNKQNSNTYPNQNENTNSNYGNGNGTGNGAGNGDGNGNSAINGTSTNSTNSNTNENLIANNQNTQKVEEISTNTNTPTSSPESGGSGDNKDISYEINETNSVTDKTINNSIAILLICIVALFFTIIGYKRQKEDEE